MARPLPIAAVLAAALLSPAAAQETVRSERGPLAVETFARGLVNPWGVAVLPDGSMLVTERPGRLRRVSAEGAVSPPLGGVPDVADVGQGGLLDVALAPDFAASRLVYLTFSEARSGGAATSLGRGRLAADGSALEGFETIFRAEPATGGGRHFGSRVVFAPDGATLFLTLGDRGQGSPSQDPTNHIGSILRLTPDGAPAPGNPEIAGARPETFAFGLRNTQGAAFQPGTGALWTSDMGPRGGDEINVIRPGLNYGWPTVSDGSEYSGVPIPDHATRPEFEAPVHVLSATAPSGVAFYDGDLIPEWRGDLLVGTLAGQSLVRLDVEGGSVRGEERLRLDRRIRDVAQGADGAVYLLVDDADGEILRLAPAR